MALQDLLEMSLNKNQKKIGLSEERLKAIVPELRKAISFYREYPDVFIDLFKADSKTFNLYFYQRVFLRAAMRHKYIYATYPRGYSKSFLSFLVLICRCILYPGAQLFITTGGKEQATGIAKEKMDELLLWIPGFKNEIDWTPGRTKSSKDEVIYKFKNGSQLDILAAKQSSRGKRKHGGLMEEVILIDGTVLNEIILPTMTVSRRLPDGTVHEEDVLNKSQIYIIFCVIVE